MGGAAEPSARAVQLTWWAARVSLQPPLGSLGPASGSASPPAASARGREAGWGLSALCQPLGLLRMCGSAAGRPWLQLVSLPHTDMFVKLICAPSWGRVMLCAAGRCEAVALRGCHTAVASRRKCGPNMKGPVIRFLPRGGPGHSRYDMILMHWCSCQGLAWCC